MCVLRSECSSFKHTCNAYIQISSFDPYIGLMPFSTSLENFIRKVCFHDVYSMTFVNKFYCLESVSQNLHCSTCEHTCIKQITH